MPNLSLAFVIFLTIHSIRVLQPGILKVLGFAIVGVMGFGNPV